MLDVFKEVALRTPAVVLDVGMGGPGGNAVGADLVPPSPNCASLSSFFMAPNEIDLSLAGSLPIELWYRESETENLLQDLRLWIKAVVDGRVHTRVWRRQGQVVRAKGRILVGDRWHHASYGSLPGMFLFGRTEKLVQDFEPYR